MNDELRRRSAPRRLTRRGRGRRSVILSPYCTAANSFGTIWHYQHKNKRWVIGQFTRVNYKIRVPQVRVLDAQGQMLGVMATRDAQRLAENRGLDLVEITPNAMPPVCKIMDYGKFRFDQLKKEKEARKNQRVVEIKEIRMSPGIDTNDLNVKMRNAMKFLKEKTLLTMS